MTMKRLQLLLVALAFGFSVSAKEYHVAKTGDDSNNGTSESPFLTIQAAADVAEAGDVITIHKGVYRESISPPRGSDSKSNPIVYQAAAGEKVEIKGSEVIGSWVKFSGTVWKASVSNELFGSYNPYKDLVHGDWFNDKGRIHHTGEVYLNGQSLWEMALLEKVLHPKPVADNWDPEGSTYTWFCESDNENTYIYANFHEANPNKELVEINVRPTCFYPDSTGINFITVRGLHMSQAATQWAPPTAEQFGLIGTNWSKGWIIENNVIRNSKCSGITLGKHGDEFDNTSENSAEGYVETINRALDRGWSKENIGSHVIRNNTISDCGVCGIAGARGVEHTLIENNVIERIGGLNLEKMYECAAIKFHFCKHSLIRGNTFRHCINAAGIWLDVDNVNTRVSGNVFEDIETITAALYSEMNPGLNLVDNNIFWDIRRAASVAGKTNADAPTDLVEGSAVRADCNEELVVAHNFFGKVEAYAVAFSLIQSARPSQGRTGLCRSNSALNNVFFACPHRVHLGRREENISDGNLYEKRQDSLSFQIAYPEPPCRQNLDGWQKYFDLDSHSTLAKLSAEYDAASGTVQWECVSGGQPECVELSMVDNTTVGPAITKQQQKGK